MLADGRVDRPHEHPQHAAEDALVVLQEIPDALGHGEHPLPHRHARDDVVDQVSGRLHHPPGVARRAQPAGLA